MDWLAGLGKNNKMIVNQHVQKNRRIRHYHQEAQNIREYKQQYYLNNIDKYTARNRKASQERTIARIRNLTDDAIVDAINTKLEEIIV